MKYEAKALGASTIETGEGAVPGWLTRNASDRGLTATGRRIGTTMLVAALPLVLTVVGCSSHESNAGALAQATSADQTCQQLHEDADFSAREWASSTPSQFAGMVRVGANEDTLAKAYGGVWPTLQQINDFANTIDNLAFTTQTDVAALFHSASKGIFTNVLQPLGGVDRDTYSPDAAAALAKYFSSAQWDAVSKWAHDHCGTPYAHSALVAAPTSGTKAGGGDYAIIDATNSGGDSLTVTYQFGTPTPAATAALPPAALDGCPLPTDRAIVVPVTVTVRNNASLAAKASLHFNFNSINPMTLFVVDYTSGPTCSAPANAGGVSWQDALTANHLETIKLWLVQPGAVTPNEPQGDPDALRSWLVAVPTVLVDQQPLATTRVHGPRAVSCENDLAAEVEMSVAGPPPTSIEAGGNRACTAQP